MTEQREPYVLSSTSGHQNRAAAIAELLSTPLSDDEVDRIAEAVASLITARVNLDDIPEMVRPMKQGEAAAFLGINPDTLSLWTQREDDPVPAFRLGARQPVYLKLELVAWLRRRPYQSDKAA